MNLPAATMSGSAIVPVPVSVYEAGPFAAPAVPETREYQLVGAVAFSPLYSAAALPVRQPVDSLAPVAGITRIDTYA